MAIPQDTVWEIDEHTKAKHEILRTYLNAWFPILTSAHPPVLYVDGFCGPGRYLGGEEGSPLIALRAAMGQRRPLPGNPVFVFTDERPDRIENLRGELQRLNPPSTFSIHAGVGRFADVFTPTLESLEREGKFLVPSFVFIDPFGFSGIPFTMIRRILRNPSCEVFITFMVNAVQRFVEHPVAAVRQEIEGLVGTNEVQQILVLTGNRVEALRGLYQRQLRTAATFVRSFEIRDAPEHILYYLFFASNNALGHEKMKDAMWGVAPEGDFRFVDNTDSDQLVLLRQDPTARLAADLAARFAGQTLQAAEILRFVMDETGFVHKHTRAALNTLEGTGRLAVAPTKVDGKKRRKASFPPEAVVAFPMTS